MTAPAEWACVICRWPPVEGSLTGSLVETMEIGVCSNLSCKTRALKKIKLKSKVKGAEYAEAVGKTTFRRTDDPSTKTAAAR